MSAANGKPKAIRLVDLSGPAGVVQLPNGKEVDVKPAPAFVVQLQRECVAIATGAAQEEAHHHDDLCKAMRVLLPDATDEERASLDVPMMVAVIAISMGHVAAVEAVLEHGRSQPTAATPAPSKSRRTTRSSTRSRK